MSRPMTEQEHMLLVEVGNSFCTGLAKLAAEHIAKLPPDLESTATSYLQDHCSIYGSSYTVFLKDFRS